MRWCILCPLTLVDPHLRTKYTERCAENGGQNHQHIPCIHGALHEPHDVCARRVCPGAFLLRKMEALPLCSTQGLPRLASSSPSCPMTASSACSIHVQSMRQLVRWIKWQLSLLLVVHNKQNTRHSMVRLVESVFDTKRFQASQTTNCFVLLKCAIVSSERPRWALTSFGGVSASH